ncbi:MazG-like family protein [Streptomyces sp. ICBB 8177]|uniref:MazG-like family protein n=1 Tax=Streptomyces sp. ICBB 8177 TaxID=563922 RepID=UPI0018EE85C5|nr:MazG-like family protein [Streptomyces sp. ICBB 8177]
MPEVPTDPTPVRSSAISLWQHARRVNAWLDSRNPDDAQETALRLLKIGEEAGEAFQAYIGASGQNPRKGVTHTPSDVAVELCDVIVAAAVALHRFTEDPEDTFDWALLAAHDRLGEQLKRQFGTSR